MKALKWFSQSSEKSKNFQAIVELSSYEHIEKRSLPKLHKAVLQEKQEKIITILNNKQCVNKKDLLGRTPLHYAAAIASEETIALLVKVAQDIDLESLDEEKKTPLFKSVEKKSPKCTQLLVEYGASIDIYDKYSEAPVHLASLNGGVEVLQVLVQAGGDINLKDSNGSTPLHLSVAIGLMDCSLYLLENGAFVNARDNKGRTPLMVSAIECNANLAKMLLDYGAQFTIKDHLGISALQHATKNRNYEIASLFNTYEGIKQVGKDKINQRKQHGPNSRISYTKEWNTFAPHGPVNIWDKSEQDKDRESVLAHEVYFQVPRRSLISVGRCLSKDSLGSKNKTDNVQTTTSNPNCTSASYSPTNKVNTPEKENVVKYISEFQRDLEGCHVENSKNDDDYFLEMEISGRYEHQDLQSGEAVEVISADKHCEGEGTLSPSAISNFSLSNFSLHAKLSPLQNNESESDSPGPHYVQSQCIRRASHGTTSKAQEMYKENHFETDVQLPSIRTTVGKDVSKVNQDKVTECNTATSEIVRSPQRGFHETQFLKELKTAVQRFQNRRENSLKVPTIQTDESFIDSLDFDKSISASPNLDILSVYEYEGDVSANDNVPSKENVLQGQRSIDSDRREPFQIVAVNYQTSNHSSSSETLSSNSERDITTASKITRPNTEMQKLCIAKEDLVQEDNSCKRFKNPITRSMPKDNKITPAGDNISMEVESTNTSTFKERSDMINSGPLVKKCIDFAQRVGANVLQDAPLIVTNAIADVSKTKSDIEEFSSEKVGSDFTLQKDKLDSFSIRMDLHDVHQQLPKIVDSSLDSFVLPDTGSNNLATNKNKDMVSREILFKSPSTKIPSILLESYLLTANESKLTCLNPVTTEGRLCENADNRDRTRTPQPIYGDLPTSCEFIKYRDFAKNLISNSSDSDSSLFSKCKGDVKSMSPNRSSSVKSFDYFSLQDSDQKSRDLCEVLQPSASDEEDGIYIAYMPSTTGTSERFQGDHTARVTSLAQSASVLRDKIFERRVKNVKLLDLLHTRKSDLEELILAMSVPIGKHADKTSKSYLVYNTEKEKLLSEVNEALQRLNETIIKEFTLADKELSLLNRCKSEIDTLDISVKNENLINLREYRLLMERASRLDRSMNELHLLAVEGSCLLDASAQEGDSKLDQLRHVNKQIELLKITSEEQDLLENSILKFIDLNKRSSTVLVKKLEDLKLAEDLFLKIADDIC